MCDSTVDLVSDLKSDLQQIRQQREKILNEQNDFFNRFYADHFTFQPGSYQINISDSEEEEEPTRMRIMTMRYQTIFDQKPKKKKERPPPEEIVQLPPPVIAKPLCIDRSTQSKKTEFRTLETQTSIKSTYVDTATVATSTAEVQTHAIRLRSEATNTDSVLPSYENVCIAFLESLLEDAPVFINNGPKPEQLEGILMDFLNQLIRDAKNFDNQQLGSEGSQNGQSILSNGPLIKRAKLSDASIQQEIATQEIATQSPISLKVLETPTRIFNYIPPPEQPRNFLFVDSGSLVTYSVAGDPHSKPDKGKDDFTYPPSLRIEPEHHPVKMVIMPTLQMESVKNDDQFQIPKPKLVNIQTGPENLRDNQDTLQETKKPKSTKIIQTEPQIPPKKMFQTEILEAENVSVEPESNNSNQPPPLPQQQQQQQPLKPPIRPSRQENIPELHNLVINPLKDIEELSEFNIDTYLKDLDFSSSDNDDDTGNISSARYSEEYSYYNDTLSNSTIDKALNSSTVSTNISVSEMDSLSIGEVRDSDYIESNEETYDSD